MVIIGSTAIKHHFPDFKREPKDIDYLVNIKSMWDNVPGKEEYHENPVLWNIVGNEKYLSPDLLYTLKISHLFWDIKWDKHMYDVQFLKGKGCVLNIGLFYKLYDYWQEVHGENKRSNLELSSQEFFNNALKKYDHDFLHLLINPKPFYKKILKDGAEVDVDEKKYNALSHWEKLELVREEVYVMAYERLAGRDYRIAYSWMLKRFIRSHAPMFEALFIIENFIELCKPIINYKKQLDYELHRINQLA